MKGTMRAIATIVMMSVAILLAGCAPGHSLLGRNPSAPTKVESALYDTVTNYVTVTNQVQQAVPVWRTNEVQVTVTNQVAGQAPVVVVTNVLERVVDHYLTNTVMVPTNVPAYTETVGAGTKASVQAAGSALNMFVPGAGGIASSAVLALLGFWGYLRSSKLGDTSSALAQEIQTMRRFIQTLPNGQAYDSALVSFLQAHQAEAGVAQEVMSILESKLQNADAQVAAQEVMRTIQQLQLQGVTPTPTPTPPRAPGVSIVSG